MPRKARDGDDTVFLSEGLGDVVQRDQGGTTDDLKILGMRFMPM